MIPVILQLPSTESNQPDYFWEGVVHPTAPLIKSSNPQVLEESLATVGHDSQRLPGETLVAVFRLKEDFLGKHKLLTGIMCVIHENAWYI